ncbi:MAG: hypothetical protein KA767_12675, partial [Saprospiraceae bacterium]|nr:hypothetical protein [Saprospiraceae bacterium]
DLLSLAFWSALAKELRLSLFFNFNCAESEPTKKSKVNHNKLNLDTIVLSMFDNRYILWEDAQIRMTKLQK